MKKKHLPLTHHVVRIENYRVVAMLSRLTDEWLTAPALFGTAETLYRKGKAKALARRIGGVQGTAQGIFAIKARA